MIDPDTTDPRYDDLSQLVRALGRGPGRSRNLERQEAKAAMAAILAGRAAPEAVGALLMLMRFRGENAAEIAGFVDAMRDRSAAWAGVGAALDWPSYAAGKSRGLPWFLLSARLVAQAGFPVLLHGWNSHPGMADPRASLAGAGVPVTPTPDADLQFNWVNIGVPDATSYNIYEFVDRTQVSAPPPTVTGGTLLNTPPVPWDGATGFSWPRPADSRFYRVRAANCIGEPGP